MDLQDFWLNTSAFLLLFKDLLCIMSELVWILGVNHINIRIYNNKSNTLFVSLFQYSAFCGWPSTALVPVCPCCWSNITACVQPLDHVAGHWLNSSSPCGDGFGLSGGDVTKLANTAPRTRQCSETEHDEDKVTFYFSLTRPAPLVLDREVLSGFKLGRVCAVLRQPCSSCWTRKYGQTVKHGDSGLQASAYKVKSGDWD